MTSIKTVYFDKKTHLHENVFNLVLKRSLQIYFEVMQHDFSFSFDSLFSM